MALAVRSVAATRLGRFADADNDTESTILSARRADASDPFLVSLSAAIWRRAVRGDEAGVDALREVGRQHQLYIPFAEFVAVALLGGVDKAMDDVRPRWTSPRNELSFATSGSTSPSSRPPCWPATSRSSTTCSSLFDGRTSSASGPATTGRSAWRSSMAVGSDRAGRRHARMCGSIAAQESAAIAGSVLEQAITDIYSIATRVRLRPRWSSRSWTLAEQRWRRSTVWARRCSPGCCANVSHRSSVDEGCLPVVSEP